MQTNPSLSQQTISGESNFTPSRPPGRSALKLGNGGFSLIEVVLALGVISFAFVALFGLLPVGLNAFNNSVDSTMSAQIAENVMSQLKQESFSKLSIFNDTNAGAQPSFFSLPPFDHPTPGYYYDDQGNPGTVGSGTAATPVVNPVAQTPTNYIYSAGVQVYYNPQLPFNTQPSVSGAATMSVGTPQSMATVVITVTKISSPRTARIYTGYIANNGL